MPKRRRPQAGQTVFNFRLQGEQELEDAFSRRLLPVKINATSPDAPPGARGVFGAVTGVAFSRTQFQGGFTLIPELPHDAILFCLPTKGHLTFHDKKKSLQATPDTALAASFMAASSIDVSRNHAHCALVINRPLLIARISLLLGRAAISELTFDPRMPTRNEPVAALRSLLFFITAQRFSSELNRAMLTATRVHEMLVDFILERWPNTYSTALSQPPPVITPRHVKLAVDFIRDHPQLVSSGTELAALTGVSLRSLQDGFRRFIGSSITGYQRQVRLERAHADLLHDSHLSVQDIAMRWGFTNASRFSRYFREAYGVSPTRLSKRRPAPAPENIRT
ncbi:AraC family transcriptional regulator [Acetobacter oeni]|uniref:AraC family transcriptional regulator n=1 Tax=Acetobacter oeni TaxID=304077 RepID=A0A511XLM3_9PROT|nr:helix-turn-helix transcriptional regulator [Acetobacter oeni]MBB3883627.1 AraC-like DNA-binding protein [Acetobacter oeni]NHO19638.1 helix-turn-helix domain-containing protein [Acetobacter oeni]GBR02674.1 AraC family transcriptional regulator [Acetobacter oeni LMG 21952]GEN63832.1 AraC family transcriptional regulator [Acetobacter oeni]